MQMNPKFVLGDAWEGQANLVCPRCGCQEVHISAVAVTQKHERTTVSKEGTRLSIAPDEGKARRGSTVVTSFFCEHGCVFSYTFQFHKGNTFVTLDAHEESVDANLDANLWRD